MVRIMQYQESTIHTNKDIPSATWNWAWRWADTREPAILACAGFPMLNSSVIQMVAVSKLIDNTRPVTYSHLWISEWEMWYAFNLCPAIEIYRTHTLGEYGLQWRQLTPC